MSCPGVSSAKVSSVSANMLGLDVSWRLQIGGTAEMSGKKTAGGMWSVSTLIRDGQKTKNWRVE